MKIINYIILVLTIISCNSIESEKNDFVNDNNPLELKLFDSLIIFSKRNILSNLKGEPYQKFKNFLHYGTPCGHGGARLSIEFIYFENKFLSNNDDIDVMFWNDQYLKNNMTNQTKLKTIDKYKFRRVTYYSYNNLTTFYLRNALMLGWKINNESSKKTDYNIIYKLVSKDSSEYISNFNLTNKTFELTYTNPNLK